MGEVLSQNEIDSLLQALSTGELDVEEMKSKDEKQVKNYDFARPAKFSKEHLRTLEIIFDMIYIEYIRIMCYVKLILCVTPNIYPTELCLCQKLFQ